MNGTPSSQLAAWRRERGMSLVAAGEKCGVSAPTFHDWEHGKKRPEEPYREILESLAGIPRDAWRTAAEANLVARVLGDAAESVETLSPSTTPEVAA